jgi:hypothetical protein
MRTVILILCVVSLLTLAATAAMASEDYWGVLFTCGWNTGSGMTNGTGIFVGAKTGNTSIASNTGYDPPNDGDAPIGVWYNSAIKGKYLVGLGDPAVPLSSYSYDIGVLVTPDYGATHNNRVYISAFACDGFNGISGRGMPTYYSVRVQNEAQTVTYAWWPQEDLYVEGNSFPDSSIAGNVGFWYTATGTGYNWASPNVQQFKVTIYGAIPEPSSLMALGSGLVALAGFAIRRRRMA